MPFKYHHLEMYKTNSNTLDGEDEKYFKQENRIQF